ncbi:fibropellin-1-like [Aplysia californica]|uniref:Fibropellin-1-like n=1 Tax=Aplysia californica TaxID=6500 RepID=A0ABM1VQX9_APLCA|nr:fibropellin-1-like [Aplysia californica]
MHTLARYSGPLCELVVDSCYSSPCYNQGTCRYRGACSCSDVVISCGWQDELCQRERCGQRADCDLLTPSYTCDCTGTGYTGLQCAQDDNECRDTPGPCLNNGVCVNTVGGYSCNCRGTGYHGDLCDVDDDECEDQNPCFNQGSLEERRTLNSNLLVVIVHAF